MRFLARFGVIGVGLLTGARFGTSVVPAGSSALERAAQADSAEPWSKAEVLEASGLARELGAKNGDAPTIVYVGFRTLFSGGHIPGATFHGTASTEKGFAELRSWLATLPRSTNLVIYCGCCPFDHCPNIRPAFKVAHELSFEHIRVLNLRKSFAADWVEKGYPMEKGL